MSRKSGAGLRRAPSLHFATSEPQWVSVMADPRLPILGAV
jgi:hypothetical protein